MSRAAYMREYRARKRVGPQLEALAETFEASGKIARAADPVAELARQLAEAHEEIRRLKRELAARPSPFRARLGNVGSSIPEYRPVPKPSQRRK